MVTAVVVNFQKGQGVSHEELHLVIITRVDVGLLSARSYFCIDFQVSTVPLR